MPQRNGNANGGRDPRTELVTQTNGSNGNNGSNNNNRNGTIGSGSSGVSIERMVCVYEDNTATRGEFALRCGVAKAPANSKGTPATYAVYWPGDVAGTAPASIDRVPQQRNGNNNNGSNSNGSRTQRVTVASTQRRR